MHYCNSVHKKWPQNLTLVYPMTNLLLVPSVVVVVGVVWSPPHTLPPPPYTAWSIHPHQLHPLLTAVDWPSTVSVCSTQSATVTRQHGMTGSEVMWHHTTSSSYMPWLEIDNTFGATSPIHCTLTSVISYYKYMGPQPDEFMMSHHKTLIV